VPSKEPPSKEHGGFGADAPQLRGRITVGPFVSLLSAGGRPDEMGQEPPDRSFATDLNLDQVITAVSSDREERDLITALFYRQLHDPATIRFRHEIFKDLEDESLFRRIKEAVELLRQVRSHLAQLEKMQSKYQREGWFLDAVAIYCEAVRSLADHLGGVSVNSPGLRSFGAFLVTYTASDTFTTLAAETAACKEALGQIRYCVRIRGGRVDVSRYAGEPDYSAEVLKTFERFKQGAVKDYRVQYRTWPGMNHVGAQILDLVARLFPGEFSALEEFCRRHGDFFDPAVRRFEREVQFYLAYLEYVAPLRAAGLRFCYPEVGPSKEVFATETFDIALAHKLVAGKQAVVTNEFALLGHERIFVVSGPNQGGKSTFARTFGQLHHLGSVGVPVAGSAARLFLFDRLFTHFEREEDMAKMRGKLEDDLVRIRDVLMAATSDSILIMNEIFTSTTLSDARYLGTKVLEKVIQLDLLALYVTFVDELASLGPSVVSMVSTIVPENPAERTFKIVRGPADGLAYALAIAEKYDLTYERLQKRVSR
jgi:DNA mismatch repair protein MutS